jgi:wobble nucleotide-excising tRNase
MLKKIVTIKNVGRFKNYGAVGDVELKQIEQLDEASRAKASEIKEKAAPIQVHVPSGVTLDAFLDLKDDPGTDAKIADKEKELGAVRQAEQIKTRSVLSAPTLPTLPAGFQNLLAKTVEGIAEDAGQRVASHIQTHAMRARGEGWLSEGLSYVNGDTCPFCAQDLAPATALLGAYKAYFSQAYNDLRTAIATMRSSVDTALGDKQIAQFERTLDQNIAGVEFWMKFCEITAPASPDGAAEKLRTLRQAALGLLDRKAAAPLDQVAVDGAFTDAAAATTGVGEGVTAYNTAVTAANAIINAKKAATGAADIRVVEAALAALRLTKKRQEPEIKKACDEYRTAQAEKAKIEEEKETAKKKLDDYTGKVIGKYEQTINRFLEDFNAGFRITDTKHAYPGGVASSSYQIVINSTPIELGDSKTPLDRPSFKNTLSSGDRSTLALAFFLAQLEHDPDRAAKIVIFDDPFNSQDSFRKDCTVQKIKKCGQTSAQVLVLSHDVGFLKRVWDRLDKQAADRKCLEMTRIGQTNTTICEWDIEKATQDQFKADRQTLTNYYHANEGNPRDVVQKIRPVVETYSRYLGGGIIADVDTLGTIVGKIRGAGYTHQLFEICDDLEELNDYTKRYHHGENPNAAIEPISDGELHGYVKRTLEITGGC